jgi:hypothetical protein
MARSANVTRLRGTSKPYAKRVQQNLNTWMSWRAAIVGFAIQHADLSSAVRNLFQRETEPTSELPTTPRIIASARNAAIITRSWF